MAWLNGDRSATYRWVSPSTTVLDIGCGYGESLGYHEARGSTAFGVELDENVRPVASLYGYNIHIGSFDPDAYEANSFDFVTLSQVIEHMTDPVAALTGVARVLKPGGMAILSTPNADGWGARLFRRRWINWHSPYHLHFFTDKSMRDAAERAGLKLDNIRSITPSSWLHYQWIHLISYPSVGKPSRFWAPNVTWTVSQKIARLFLTVLHFLRFNHVATRFFDAIGIGDSRLYFLSKP